MACKNCFDNCAEPSASAKCIRYMGDPVPLLDICTGDSISYVESVILESLLTCLDGTGILPKDVTLENAPDLKQALGFKSPSLNNLLQILIDNQQTLTELVSELEESAPFVFDIKSLTGLGDDPTRDEILQAVINQLDTVKKTVDLIPTTYVKLTDLTVLVNNIISGTSSSTSSQQYLKLVPNVAVPYFGSLSNFDNTGKGLVGMGFDKIYLCNGLNGTPDIRGRVVAGALQNVPGGTLGADVDPSSPSNPNTNYAVGDKFGKSYHTLSVSEIPSHSHVVSDPGHKHGISTYENDSAGGGQQHSVYNGTDNDAVPTTLQSTLAYTNISIQATGGGLAHNNVQPSIAAYYIIHLL